MLFLSSKYYENLQHFFQGCVLTSSQKLKTFEQFCESLYMCISTSLAQHESYESQWLCMHSHQHSHQHSPTQPSTQPYTASAQDCIATLGLGSHRTTVGASTGLATWLAGSTGGSPLPGNTKNRRESLLHQSSGIKDLLHLPRQFS